jgi:hypothetical protein
MDFAQEFVIFARTDQYSIFSTQQFEQLDLLYTSEAKEQHMAMTLLGYYTKLESYQGITFMSHYGLVPFSSFERPPVELLKRWPVC